MIIYYLSVDQECETILARQFWFDFGVSDEVAINQSLDGAWKIFWLTHMAGKFVLIFKRGLSSLPQGYLSDLTT